MRKLDLVPSVVVTTKDDKKNSVGLWIELDKFENENALIGCLTDFLNTDSSELLFSDFRNFPKCFYKNKDDVKFKKFSADEVDFKNFYECLNCFNKGSLHSYSALIEHSKYFNTSYETGMYYYWYFCWRHLGKFKTPGEFGEYMLMFQEQTGALSNEELKSDFDFDKYTKDLFITDYIYTDTGDVFKNISVEQMYEGA